MSLSWVGNGNSRWTAARPSRIIIPRYAAAARALSTPPAFFRFLCFLGYQGLDPEPRELLVETGHAFALDPGELGEENLGKAEAAFGVGFEGREQGFLLAGGEGAGA